MRAPRWIRALCATWLVGACVLVAATPAAAAKVTVSTEAQLRAALADPATTTVTLANSIDLVDCSPDGGDLDRDGALVLDGGGFTLRQTCAGERVLESTAGALTLQHVTITGGDLSGIDPALGGGVRVVGDLVLDDVRVTGNTVTANIDTPYGPFGGGGGIAGDSTITVTDSHVDGNAVVGERVGWGGGIYSTHQNAVTVTDSTADGNTLACSTDMGLAFCGGGGVSTLPFDGAGPFVPRGEGRVTLVRASVSGNETTALGDHAATTQAWAMGGGVQAAIVDATDSHIDGNSLVTSAGYATNVLGAGVVTNADATLLRSTIDGNSASSSGTTYSSGTGGGIAVDATLTATDSSVSHNSVRAVDGSSGTQMGGGGAGVLVLTRVIVEGNTAEGGTSANAGGVSSYDSSMSITASTIIGNTARAVQPDGAAYAGGLRTQGGAVESTTITGNRVIAPGAAHAGGVMHAVHTSFDPDAPAPDLTVVNSTIVGNEVTGDTSWAGGVEEVGGRTTTLRFTTVAGNSSQQGANLMVGSRMPDYPNAPIGGTIAATATVVASPQGGGANCDALTLASDAFVHVTDTSCGIDAGGDPQLGALTDNGGPTLTMLPSATSPLLDQVPSEACLALVAADQRGVTRPQGTACDIGAVEREVPPPPDPEPVPTPTPERAPVPTPTDGPTAAPAIVADPRFTG